MGCSMFERAGVRQQGVESMFEMVGVRQQGGGIHVRNGWCKATRVESMFEMSGVRQQG